MVGTTGIQSAELVFLLLLGFIVFFAILAQKLNTPYPIVLVLAGLGLGLVPGIPHIPMDPDVVFLVVLPPLLYAAAWNTSWREFSRNSASIYSLAFGLVGFTVVGVALAAPKFLPGFDWQSALLLGAVVSPTDAIAATSVGQRLGLPKRVMEVLEGESLVNDASGLLALEFGIGLVSGGRLPSVGFAVSRLFYLIVAGVLIGLLIGWIVNRLERLIDNGPVEIAISILVPYSAYLAAQAINASGVLAVVACGLYLGRKSTGLFSPSVRLQAYGVWDAFTFLLNGFVFVMIGLQLPTIMEQFHGLPVRTAIKYGALFSLLLIALRLVWIYPGAGIATLIRKYVQHQPGRFPPAKQVFVVGWTGMRGVVALAAALSIPETLPNGAPFMQRDLIIFLAFTVILVTLVLQGLTLPWFIRRLGLMNADGPDCEEREARRIVLEAALERVEAMKSKDQPEYAGVYDHVAKHYKARLYSETGDEGQLAAGVNEEVLKRFRAVDTQARSVERETAIRLRDEDRISDEVLRRLEWELDLVDLRLDTKER